ncbi:MAG: basic amino acid/polyamine antiporter, family [Clostridia bacterium]|nr:basic amino acid/polyamine antiporter, family [Clostridia bacterium]
MRGILRRKPVEVVLNEERDGTKVGLRRRLGAFDLTTMGIGAIIGTGIFVLTGVAAASYAGPAAVLSFVLAGVASALAAPISALLYVAVALVLTGMVSYRLLNVPSPLGFALLKVGAPWASVAISVGALAGLSSVILVNIFGQSRIFFAMARDGLLPQGLTCLHPRYNTPYVIIILTAGLVAAIGGLIPIGVVAELANIGTCLV